MNEKIITIILASILWGIICGLGFRKYGGIIAFFGAAMISWAIYSLM